MKGLIQKDIYMLTTQLKFQLFLIIIYCVCFSFIGNGMLGMLGIFIAALLSNGMFTLDEQSKWDKFALTMPYSRKDIVLSRYILSAVLAAGAAVLYILSGSAVVYIIKSAYEEAQPFGSYAAFGILAFSLALFSSSLALPVTIKFGSLKGRYALILIGAVCGVIYGVGYTYINEKFSAGEEIKALSGIELYAAVLIVSLICFAVSAAVSIKLYSNKDVG